MKKISLLCFLCSLLLVPAGCGTLDKSGVYAGDKFAYNADLTIVTSQDFLQAFVKWEFDNRAALAGTPEIKQSADAVRKGAKQWISSAIRLREAYAANPTPGNQAALVSALDILHQALTEAAGYMAAAAQPKPSP